jgi:hypothetical protein
VLVDLKNFSSCHIDVSVRRNDCIEDEWRFTGFYGAPGLKTAVIVGGFFGPFLL